MSPIGWVEEQRAEQAKKAAAAAKAHTGHKNSPPPAASAEHSGARSAWTPDELEAWAQAGIDREIDELEADPAGTRNDRLNKRALRCFRLALAADFDLDDVQSALVAACHVNKLVADDGINSVQATLRSARGKATADGPCDGPDDNVDVVGAEHFEK